MTPQDSPPSSEFVHGPNENHGRPRYLSSPLLHALSSTSPHWAATEWTRNVPAYSTSPGNLISLSDSPPTMPSSYNDDGLSADRLHNTYKSSSTATPAIAIPQNSTTSTAAMNSHDGHFVSPRDNPTDRSSSIFAQVLSEQPVSHQFAAQHRHSQGVSLLSAGLDGRLPGQKNGSSSGCYCAFDSAAGFAINGKRELNNILISGYYGGVDVYNITRTDFEKAATIDGLRGGVYSARIIPCHINHAHDSSSPLIVLVIHGPLLAQPNTDDLVGESGTQKVTDYQTTVEIYSLVGNKHITTLMSLPITRCNYRLDDLRFVAPNPTGALTLTVDSTTILVSSGVTGEVWIFRQQLDLLYCCVGKVWTALQTVPTDGMSSSSEAELGNSAFKESRLRSPSSRSPILSLKDQWLAYSPSVSKEQTGVKAMVHATIPNIKAYGVNSYTPPLQPSVNCAVDASDPEKLLSQVSRVVTQGVVKSAKFVAKEGFKVWDNYWANGSQDAGTNASRVNHSTATDFPPTHGENIPASLFAPKADLVSIIDLDQLSQIRTGTVSAPPAPLVTFKPPHGCSFISFSPNGLNLLTASENGDVQIVWDLMRISHTKSSLLQIRHSSSMASVHVRQIALYTRLTAARIVDVIWCWPQGERIAMITDRNTIHFLNIPASAFVWPASRRRTAPVKQIEPFTEADDDPAPTTTTMITAGAVNVVKGFKAYAVPFMPRRMSGVVRAPLTTASIANVGTGFVAGLSKSMGAAASGTVEHFRKAGDNKLHLPVRTGKVTPGSIKWIGTPKSDCIAALVDGAICLYSFKQSSSTTRSGAQRKTIGHISTRFVLPVSAKHPIEHENVRKLNDGHDLAKTVSKELPIKITRIQNTKFMSYAGTECSVPYAEIEPNAPYQPFHTDRRVTLNVYLPDQIVKSNHNLSIYDCTRNSSDRSEPEATKTLIPLRAPQSKIEMGPDAIAAENDWIFGQPILSTRVHIRSLYGSEEEDGLSSPATSDVERVTTADEDQIVVTTRRRKSAIPGREEEIDDGDGFFEDDCAVLDFANQRV